MPPKDRHSAAVITTAELRDRGKVDVLAYSALHALIEHACRAGHQVSLGEYALWPKWSADPTFWGDVTAQGSAQDEVAPADVGLGYVRP